MGHLKVVKFAVILRQRNLRFALISRNRSSYGSWLKCKPKGRVYSSTISFGRPDGPVQPRTTQTNTATVAGVDQATEQTNLLVLMRASAVTLRKNGLAIRLCNIRLSSAAQAKDDRVRSNSANKTLPANFAEELYKESCLPPCAQK